MLVACVFLCMGLSTTAVASDSHVVVYIDGEQFSTDTHCFINNSVTYVPVADFSSAMNKSSSFSWDEQNKCGTVSAPNLSVKVDLCRSYISANGRYFYLKEPVIIKNGKVYCPVRELSKCFGASVSWNDKTRSVHIKRGVGYVQNAGSFYNSKDLYWLSRIISAESKGEPLDGKIAVGNVIMNRVIQTFRQRHVIDSQQ